MTSPLSKLAVSPQGLAATDRRALRVGAGVAPLAALLFAWRGWQAWTPMAARLFEALDGGAATLGRWLSTRPAAALAAGASGAVVGLLLGAALVWALRAVPGLHANRRLVRDFVRRDLRARYAGAWLGFFWSVVNPLVSLVVYLFVFRIVLKARWSDTMGGEEVTLIMLSGIVVWSALAESLGRATTTMIDNANLIQKVVFPAEVLPAFLSVSALFNMTLGLPVVLAGTVWIGGHSADYLGVREAALAAGKDVGPALQVGLSLAVLPLLYLLQFLFMTGLGCFMATLNVLVRDVQQLVGVATMVWMFGTPIFYPAELVRRAGYGFLLELNPMYWLIDAYRDVLLYAAWPDWSMLLRFGLMALIVLAVGTRFLARHKARFPDLL